MAEHGLIIIKIINQDPLGETCEAIYNNEHVVIKKYNKKISEVIQNNFLEFKTSFQASKLNSNQNLLKTIEVIVENGSVIVIYEKQDNLNFLSNISILKENSRDAINLENIYDSNFWIDLILPFIKSLKLSHELGQFHGLINPYNIAFTKDYELKILGFGFEYKILSWLSTNQINSLENSSGLLIPFLDIKFFDNQEFDFQSDIYALAALIYYFYNDTSPYEELSIKEAKNLSINIKEIAFLNFKKNKVLKQLLNYNNTDISNGLDLIINIIYRNTAIKSGNKNYYITLSFVLVFGMLAYSYKHSSFTIKEKHYNNIAIKKTPSHIKKDSNVSVKKIAVKEKVANLYNHQSNYDKVLQKNDSLLVKNIDINNDKKKYDGNKLARKKNKQTNFKDNINKNKENLKNKSQEKPREKPQEKVQDKIVKRYYKLSNVSKDSVSCSNSIVNGDATKVCNDILKNQIKGPEYYKIYLSNYNQQLNVTTPIRVIDYKKYCYFTKKCDYFSTDEIHKKNKLLGEDFSEVMNSIKKYNIYCLLTDNCSGLNNSKIKEPIIGLSQKEITEYVDWLNMVSGAKYSILNNKQALNNLANNFKKECSASSSKTICNAILNNYKDISISTSTKNNKTAYVLVRNDLKTK